MNHWQCFNAKNSKCFKNLYWLSLVCFSDPMNNMCNPDVSTEGDVFTTNESNNKPTEKVMRKSWAPSTNSTTSDEIPSNGHLSSAPVDVSNKEDFISVQFLFFSFFLFLSMCLKKCFKVQHDRFNSFMNIKCCLINSVLTLRTLRSHLWQWASPPWAPGLKNNWKF